MQTKLAITLLNPTAEQLHNVWNDWTDNGRARDLARSLFERESDIDNQYSYADGSYTGEMDEGRLQDIMDENRNDPGDLGVNTDVGASTGERTPTTSFCPLAPGVPSPGDLPPPRPNHSTLHRNM